MSGHNGGAQRDAIASRSQVARSNRPSTGRFGSAADDGPGNPRDVSRAIARAKQGDQDALRFLYLRYAERVYGYVVSIVRDEHEAEDVTQKVFLNLIIRLHHYEERETPFIGWVLRVARNATIDHLRQRRAVPCAELDGLERHTYAVDNDRSSVLHEALAALPGDQREVVVLRHVIGMTPREIAKRLGRSEAAVHGLHNRGRSALRRELEQLGSAPVTAAAA
jgi:RNA polymerase sigma-70 factor (ECF subfamily)